MSGKLALVIPALYEAANLGSLLTSVRNVLEHAGITWEVIVVDDHSCDGTEQIVSAIAREDARIRLLVRRYQRGLSGAILHGWQQTDATILGVMDADGQHPAEALPTLLASIQRGHDVAIASRCVGTERGRWNPLRHWLSTIAIIAARPLQPMRLQVRDPLSGFFMVRRLCVDGVPFQATGFKLLVEILARGRIASIEEMPFAFGRRRSGRSKMSFRVAWDYLILLVRLYQMRFGIARHLQAASGD